jgi:2-dehydropantoate 2-reductase
MGCLFAAKLKKSGNNVTLLDYRPDRARLISQKGLNVEGISGHDSVRVDVLAEMPSQPIDVVLFCVKANNTRQAVEGIAPRLQSGTLILTLQNGLGNMETLVDVLGRDRVLGGITQEGATVIGPGHIRHAGQGETVFGPSKMHSTCIQQIVSVFRTAGFSTRSVKDVKGLIWGKLVINTGINALAAITGLRNGQLPHVPGTNQLMRLAVQEAVEVANAKGVLLPYPDPLRRVMEVCKATAGNVASMLQDISSKRPTEVDFINGAIVKEGQMAGIKTPVNQTLTLLIRTIQETYDQRVGCV